MLRTRSSVGAAKDCQIAPSSAVELDGTSAVSTEKSFRARRPSFARLGQPGAAVPT